MTIIISDDFTLRAGLLVGRSPDIGAGAWTCDYATPGSLGTAVTTVGVGVTGNPADLVGSVYIPCAFLTSSDYYVEVTFTIATTSVNNILYLTLNISPGFTPAFGLDGAFFSGYYPFWGIEIRPRNGAGGLGSLDFHNYGGQLVDACFGGSAPLTFTQLVLGSHTLKAVCGGTNLNVYIDGALMAASTNPAIFPAWVAETLTYTTPGVGFRFQQNTLNAITITKIEAGGTPLAPPAAFWTDFEHTKEVDA